jgi:hypothetical protein
MLNNVTPIKEIVGCENGLVPEWVASSEQPLILRGLVADWPIVRAARRSNEDADHYLRGFYAGAPVTASSGAAEIEGRVFYNAEMTGFNFQMQRMQLDAFLDQLLACQNDPHPPLHYVGSTSVDHCLPGFRAENNLQLDTNDGLLSLWVGNQSRIAAHYDIPNNIACVAIGKRRFTLFPPDQLENLYIGPLDFAPAGQSISLVDLHDPDFDKYPKFRQALQHSQSAELEPGDAIFIPSMWWHHVEGLGSYNLLINYWWSESPAYMGSPADVLNHAFLSLRDLPAEQRKAWQGIFEHYIFQPDDSAATHIPEHSRGVLGPADDNRARKLRALLLKQLNR